MPPPEAGLSISRRAYRGTSPIILFPLQSEGKIGGMIFLKIGGMIFFNYFAEM
jgi:hypothetical protein